MLVAIHQPTFVPWLGYLDRMLRSDLFVILDHVQFERRNYQNRTLIRLEDEAKLAHRSCRAALAEGKDHRQARGQSGGH